ncbi:hypothetical protein [Shinella sp. M31]|uniref:hypothetical protein n=1 Tax=Shinella sp. M31 TaxID=3368615 RepID=UPI003BA010DC
MRGADKNAALALCGMRRWIPVDPGRQTRSADATSEQSRMAAPADRAKRTAKIDIIPFVPSHSAFCRKAQALLFCGVPFASLAAVLAIVFGRLF